MSVVHTAHCSWSPEHVDMNGMSYLKYTQSSGSFQMFSFYTSVKRNFQGSNVNFSTMYYRFYHELISRLIVKRLAKKFQSLNTKKMYSGLLYFENCFVQIVGIK